MGVKVMSQKIKEMIKNHKSIAISLIPEYYGDSDVVCRNIEYEMEIEKILSGMDITSKTTINYISNIIVEYLILTTNRRYDIIDFNWGDILSFYLDPKVKSNDIDIKYRYSWIYGALFVLNSGNYDAIKKGILNGCYEPIAMSVVDSVSEFNKKNHYNSWEVMGNYNIFHKSFFISFRSEEINKRIRNFVVNNISDLNIKDYISREIERIICFKIRYNMLLNMTEEEFDDTYDDSKPNQIYFEFSKKIILEYEKHFNAIYNELEEKYIDGELSFYEKVNFICAFIDIDMISGGVKKINLIDKLEDIFKNEVFCCKEDKSQKNIYRLLYFAASIRDKSKIESGELGNPDSRLTYMFIPGVKHNIRKTIKDRHIDSSMTKGTCEKEINNYLTQGKPYVGQNDEVILSYYFLKACNHLSFFRGENEKDYIYKIILFIHNICLEKSTKYNLVFAFNSIEEYNGNGLFVLMSHFNNKHKLTSKALFSGKRKIPRQFFDEKYLYDSNNFDASFFNGLLFDFYKKGEPENYDSLEILSKFLREDFEKSNKNSLSEIINLRSENIENFYETFKRIICHEDKNIINFFGYENQSNSFFDFVLKKQIKDSKLELNECVSDNIRKKSMFCNNKYNILNFMWDYPENNYSIFAMDSLLNRNSGSNKYDLQSALGGDDNFWLHNLIISNPETHIEVQSTSMGLSEDIKKLCGTRGWISSEGIEGIIDYIEDRSSLVSSDNLDPHIQDILKSNNKMYKNTLDVCDIKKITEKDIKRIFTNRFTENEIKKILYNKYNNYLNFAIKHLKPHEIEKYKKYFEGNPKENYTQKLENSIYESDDIPILE